MYTAVEGYGECLVITEVLQVYVIRVEVEKFNVA